MNNESNKKLNDKLNNIKKMRKIIESNNTKIVHLNVGGKFFDINLNTLNNSSLLTKLLDISPNVNLHNKIYYFFDLDFKYFKQIIDLIEKNNIDIFLEKNKNSSQLINELIKYNLIDRNYYCEPKIKLIIDNNNEHISDSPKRIVTIKNKNYTFQTYYDTISKCNYFNKLLNDTKDYKLVINDIEPKEFRYILQLLRNNELSILNKKIFNYLNKINIKFSIHKNDNIKLQHEVTKENDNIKLQHEVTKENDQVKLLHNYTLNDDIYHNNDIAMIHPLLSQKIIYENDTQPFANIMRKNIYTKEMNDNEYTSSSNTYRLIKMDNIKISNNNVLMFFDLSKINFLQPDLIEDIVLMIDLKNISTEQNFGHKILNNVKFIIQNTEFNIPGKYINICHQSYENNLSELSEMLSLNKNNIHNYIDNNNKKNIQRIAIPLKYAYPSSEKNSIPLKKLINNEENIKIIINLNNHENKLISETNECMIVNSFIITNCIYLNEHKSQEYVFINTKAYTIPIKFDDKIETNHIIDNIVNINIPTKLIKDIIISIENIDKYFNNSLMYENSLIDMTVNFVIMNEINPYCHVDNIMLNKYLPLKYLNHTLNDGLYYYTFSPKPMHTMISGGVIGKDILLDIRTYNVPSIITIYVNTYEKLTI
jgi:hypothetical protein